MLNLSENIRRSTGLIDLHGRYLYFTDSFLIKSVAYWVLDENFKIVKCGDYCFDSYELSLKQLLEYLKLPLEGEVVDDERILWYVESVAIYEHEQRILDIARKL